MMDSAAWFHEESRTELQVLARDEDDDLDEEEWDEEEGWDEEEDEDWDDDDEEDDDWEDEEVGRGGGRPAWNRHVG
jgi:hypothetical protein